jgi:fatty acid desaturase
MLRYSADIRTLAIVGVYGSMVTVGYLATAASWPMTLALMVMISLLSYFCAVATHNTVHTPVFKERLYNRVFQVVLTLCYGHPVSMFVPGHNLSHHRFTQTPRDGMRTDKLRHRSNLLNIMLFTVTVTPAVLQENLKYARLMRTRRPRWFAQLMLETVVMFAVMGGLLYINWQAFLLFVVIPHQFAQWGIVAINFAQHDGCDADDPYNHSRNFTGFWLNWFCFNNGFHGIHHMRPSMHWSLLADAHARELRPYMHPNLDQPSLLGWGFRVAIWPGVRKDYLGQPLVLDTLRPDESWVDILVDEDAGQMGAMDDAIPVG